ncbi:hypothetical protein [Devosia crocina]|nr:hypothetical protein [Devosia crocina]
MTPSRRRLDAVRLKHLAEDGWVLIYRCNYCRNETAFLASDVVDIWGPEMKAFEPPQRCGRCRVSGYMRVQHYFPTSIDVGKLRLRRPAGKRSVQVWKWEMYGGPGAR